MKEWSPFRHYGCKHGRMAPQDGIAAACLLAIGVWLWQASADLPQYEWQWSLLRDFLYIRDSEGNIRAGLLLRGLAVTLRIGFWTFLLAFILGGWIGFFCARKPLWQCLPAMAFINFMRNTPPLVILFAIYFFAGNILPVAALEDMIRHWTPAARELAANIVAPPGQLDRMLAAVLALGCYQAAYMAEIARGAVAAVPHEQWDAAIALGFGQFQALRLVILPQAFRIMLPPLTGLCISTFKESALAALISLPDLTFQSLEIMAVSNMTFEIWITAAALYLGIGVICAAFGRMLEKRLDRCRELPSEASFPADPGPAAE